jgi:hypothetical protein
MKSYLATLATIILGTLVVAISLSAIGIMACMKCELLRYQESKIGAASDVDTVFLGDSTIGYALDAHEFSAVSGRKTLNLALTGFNYGIGGAFALLTEVSKRAQPKNIVIAFTPQTFAFSIDKLKELPIQGFVQTLRWYPWRMFRINQNVSSLVEAMISSEIRDRKFMADGLVFLRGGRTPVPDYFHKYDYLEPSPRKLDLKTVEFVNLGRASDDYDAFFRKTGEFCRDKGLNCLYMHGTLLDSVAAQNRPYLKDFSDRIERAGIKVIRESPVEIPSADIANTMNHVRSDLRRVYTRKIYEMIKDELR